ncbi:universal stress protein [Paracoccus seriniphilus]|uniref:Nucleotide-binding universal stress protein, UspA family n=1 Tax=Paracoccus seriniphilus TaxID=184748 RepID=A0A239PVQ6_9RHOB|nr:universal stress protein [Paracoccus seriniphilus]WCR15526.1 universal stress protein [Paracoccus seriniphilus]SNT74026.1 Nucleotide-binding universal stress protein, UspA family [Paracoccus seriniphilus]
MFSNIMIPVDLGHAEKMTKAVKVAADMARLYGATVHLVGVGQTVPTAIAHTPAEYSRKLAAFADECSAALGIAFNAHAEVSHDPAVDLDDVLLRTADKLDADLIVMASHVPGFAEHFLSSNAGYLASHAKRSVLVVR